MDLLAYIVIAILAFVTYIYWRFKDLPPGPYGIPFLGYALFMGNTAKEREDKFAQLTKKYGKIFSLNLANERVVVVNDYALIMEVLVKQGPAFSGRPPNFAMDFMFERKEMLTGDGPLWKDQKRFAMKVLQNLGMSKSSMESIIMDQVENLSEELDNYHGKPVEMTHIFFIPALNVIWGLAAGKRMDVMDKSTIAFQTAIKDMELVTAQTGLLNIFPALRHIAPDLMGYTLLNTSKQAVYNHIKQEVDSHIEKFDANSLNDFIDYFIAEMKNKNEAPPYTKDNLIYAIFTLFAAGTETTSSTLSWIMLFMVLNPEVQKKVHQEMKTVIGENTYLSAASKNLVPYAEATLLECLRLSSIGPLSVPHLSLKETVLEGYKIPAGTTILTNLYNLHHDDYWGDPHNFRPERFLDGNGQVKKESRLLAFSSGPRVCMGEHMAKTELFLFFTCLMHRFSFEVIPGQPKPSSEPVGGISVFPKEFSVIVKRVK